MISIVDYGVGNLGSILNMFKRIGVHAELVNRPDAISASSRLLLPGVGAFDSAMQELRSHGFIEPLLERVISDGVPLMGVCLGMQLLGHGSDEGELPGLGLVQAHCSRFDAASLKVPHMGWNSVKPRKPSTLLRGLDDDSRFYFVHSYHMVCENPEDILATTGYGHDFVSMVERGNVMGAQFHPEKSHRFGMELFKRFAEQ
jgi:glutamine amidotransferase